MIAATLSKEHDTMGLKWTEILLIMGVLMLLFGASRLPQLGSSLGSAIRNFKKGFGGEETPEEKAQADKAKLAEGSGSAIPAGEKSATKQG
jgi:sec-independent protein translocase protein TatA